MLSTGDIVTLGARYPNIDFANGGSIDGMIAGADLYLKLAGETTKIVPGHGPLTDKAGVAAYRQMLATARERVAKLIADGKISTMPSRQSLSPTSARGSARTSSRTRISCASSTAP